MVWVNDSFFMGFTRHFMVIIPLRQKCPQKCPKWGLRVKVWKTQIAHPPKNWVVTETLTKRIFAPENATLIIFGGRPRVGNGGGYFIGLL